MPEVATPTGTPDPPGPTRSVPPASGTPTTRMRRAAPEIVLGVGPVAEALAGAVGQDAPTVLAGPVAREGPFLWRHADLHSGQGLPGVLSAARRAYVVLDGTPFEGALALLDKADVPEVVTVSGWGEAVPPSVMAQVEWSRIELGPCWGPTEPLVARWSRDIASGRHVWVADPGPIAVLAMTDAVNAVRACVSMVGARWRLSGPPARLPDLADALAHFHDRPLRATRFPLLALALHRTGIPASRIREWLEVPANVRETAGWTPPEPSGRAGWIKGLKRQPR